MRNLIMCLVVVMVGVVHGQVFRSSGYGDTSRVCDKIMTNGVYDTSRVFDLSRSEVVMGVIKVDDTTSAGFGGDSLLIEWGYQTGRRTLNSGGTRDTAWGPWVVLDTVKTDSLGVMGSELMSTAGVVAYKPGNVDTLSVSGFAVQGRVFSPGWDEFIRYRVMGITGNKGADTLNCFIEHRGYGKSN